MKVRAIMLLVMTALFLTVSAGSVFALGAMAYWQDSKDMESGYGFGLKQKFQIVPVFSLEARASWIGYDGAGDYSKLNMYPLEAVGLAKIGLLYGGAGVGYYLFSGDDKPDNKTGAFLAGGLEGGLAGLGVFGELRYLFLEPGGDNGRDMSGFGGNIGIRVEFGG